MFDNQQRDAIRQSVQTTDLNLVKKPTEVTSASDFWGYIEHPDIIPAWGTKERDRRLRMISYRAHNTLFQGAIAGLIMRVQATPWEIEGGRNNARYYQSMLQNSDFHDWETWIARLLWDFLTQDFGSVTEIIGKGSADRAISGRVVGLAHMDALSVYATKVAEHPLLYWNEEDGARHLLHATRAYRFTDMPSSKRLAYGTGLCALSRYISEANVDILLGRHDNEMLSDLPPAGMLAVSGMTQPQWQDAQRAFEADRQADGESVFRGTMVIHSIKPDAPIKVESIPFSALPQNFDVKAFVDLHVNKLALALGVDPQDIWPLSGQALGTGTQSTILHSKAQGKMFGRILQMITRFINRAVLPDGLEFQFKFKDVEADAETANTAKVWVDIANGAQFLTDEEKRRLLADNVEAFADILLDEAGELVELPDDDPKPSDQLEIVAPDDNPNANTPVDNPATLPDGTVNQQPRPGVPGQGGQPDPRPNNFPIRERSRLDADLGERRNAGTRQKDYADTRSEYVDDVAAIIQDAASGTISPAAFSIRMRAALSKYGKAAYLDGMEDGGVEVSTLEGDDSDAFAALLASQSGYVTDARRSIADWQGDPTARSERWEASLNQFYYAGAMSADKNAMYRWDLSNADHCDTCKRLNGQVHRLKDWIDRDLRPKSSKLDCKMGCKCTLTKTSGRSRGSY